MEMLLTQTLLTPLACLCTLPHPPERLSATTPPPDSASTSSTLSHRMMMAPTITSPMSAGRTCPWLACQKSMPMGTGRLWPKTCGETREMPPLTSPSKTTQRLPQGLTTGPQDLWRPSVKLVRSPSSKSALTARSLPTARLSSTPSTSKTIQLARRPTPTAASRMEL